MPTAYFKPFMAKPDRRIIATRPLAQNSGWATRLQALGYQVAELPLLDITAVATAAGQQAVKDCILELDSYDAVIFVSQNAVEHAWQQVETYWPQLPLGLNLIAVGRSTATRVSELFELPVTSAQQAMNTEELLALPQLMAVAGKKILICRGQGGRPTLGTALESRGARVDYCELYRRGLPTGAGAALGRLALNPATDVIALFSGETFENLCLAASAAELDPTQLRQVPLLVPGERVARMATEAGFNQVWAAVNASEQAMLETLNGHAL